MRFVRQTQTIRMTNFDDRLMIEKKICKHGNMLPISIRYIFYIFYTLYIICGPSNCGKTNVLISLLENPHGIRFENVHIFEIASTKYRSLKNLFAQIEEIGYFTYSNNSDTDRITERGASKFHFYL